MSEQLSATHSPSKQRAPQAVPAEVPVQSPLAPQKSGLLRGSMQSAPHMTKGGGQEPTSRQVPITQNDPAVQVWVAPAQPPQLASSVEVSTQLAPHMASGGAHALGPASNGVPESGSGPLSR